MGSVEAMLSDVYTVPLEYLRRCEPPAGYVFGRVRVSGLEIETAKTDEGAFVGLLSARLYSTLGDMVAELTAPTFPVHDEPLR